MKRIFLTISFIVAGLFISCSKKKDVKPLKPEVSPRVSPELKAEPFGINLAGAEFGVNMPGTFNRDYTYPTVTQLDYLKAKGLNLVRLPFKWERIQPSLRGSLDNLELSRLKNFVDAAESRGIKVILDMHNYGRRKINGTEHIIGSPDLSIDDVADVWGKLAVEFKSKTNIWAYGLMNEPHGMLTSVPWFSIAQALINKIRMVDSKTTILVAGDGWSSAWRWPQFSNNLKDLVDPYKNLVFEAHLYFDDDASGKYDQSYDEEKASANTGVERVIPFINWLSENKLRGFVGEYGVPDNDPRWLVTLDNLLKYMKSNCVNGTYWAAGPWWGNYTLAVEPKNGIDRPQMETLMRYKATDPANCK